MIRSLPEFVSLVQNIYLMIDVLIRQKGADVGSKLQQFFKSITERNQNTEFVTSWCIRLAGGFLRIAQIRVIWAITL